MTCIVTGTGRSGTSLCAAILHHLGVHMGYTFVPKNSSNPIGHYEDIEFHGLNLIYLDGFCTEDEWLSQLIPLIRRRNKLPIWGFKSPNTTQLIPYYTQLIPQAKWIICKRSLSEFALSTRKAYGWSEDRSAIVYKTRSRQIESHLENYHSIQLTDLISLPGREIERLICYCGLSPTEEQQAKARSLIMPKGTGYSIKDNKELGKKTSTIKAGTHPNPKPTKTPKTTMKGQNA